MAQHVFTPDRIKVPASLWIAGTLTGHLARYLTATTGYDCRDDSTFLLPATRIVHGNPNRTLSGPRWKRIALRWSFVGLPLPLGLTELASRATGGLWELVGAVPPDWTTAPYWEIAATSMTGGALALTGTYGWRLAERFRNRPAKPFVWSEFAALARKADLAHPIIGQAPNGQPVRLDFAQDSAHSFASAPSGAGKSTLYKALFAQRLRNGAGLVVLDYKDSSAYDYLERLPENMVRVFVDPATIGEVLLLLKAEKDYRRDNRRATPDGFRTLDVLVEEANSLAAVLGMAWTDAGNKGPNKWVAALSELVFMGREFGIHLHYAAQRADAAVFGGGAQRESFQLRLMAQQSEATWKMLGGGMPFQPPAPGGRGAWTLVSGSRSWTYLRVPLLSDADALDLALEGSGEHLGGLTHGVELPRSRETLAMSEDTEELLLADEGLVTLSQHADATGQSLGALRARVQRARVEPRRPARGRVGALYHPDDLS